MKILHFFYLAAWCWALPAQAGFVNGGFETGGLGGWANLGDAGVANAGFGAGPVAGSFQALLTTASTATDGYNYSGNDAVAANQLERFLQLAAGSLGAIEGSGISQSFTANGGDRLSFAWNFLTDIPSQLGFNDYAFAVLDGTLIPLGSTFSALQASNSPFINETGFTGFTQILTGGSHTLGFGVVDVGDGLVTSGLLIDNVSLTKAVPEPGEFALLAAGFIAMAASRRRQKPDRAL